MKRLDVALLIFLAPPLATVAEDACAQSPTASQPSAQGGAAVQFQRVLRVSGPGDAPLYAISFTYEVAGREAVYLGGLGTVRSQGSFTYVSPVKHLEFRESAGGQTIAVVPFQETTYAASGPLGIQFPSESDFPASHRAFTWSSPGSFQKALNAVLNRHFLYSPRENNRITYISTTYALMDLPRAPRGTLGQIALLISYPYDPSPRGFDFRVQCLVREGRSGSDEWRPTRNPELLGTADTFLKNLLDEITTVGGAPK